MLIFDMDGTLWNTANTTLKSANEISEPLFGRFAHVYIDTNSQEWLKWALNRKKTGKKLIYKNTIRCF